MDGKVCGWIYVGLYSPNMGTCGVGVIGSGVTISFLHEKENRSTIKKRRKKEFLKLLKYNM